MQEQACGRSHGPWKGAHAGAGFLEEPVGNPCWSSPLLKDCYGKDSRWSSLWRTPACGKETCWSGSWRTVSYERNPMLKQWKRGKRSGSNDMAWPQLPFTVPTSSHWDRTTACPRHSYWENWGEWSKGLSSSSWSGISGYSVHDWYQLLGGRGQLIAFSPKLVCGGVITRWTEGPCQYLGDLQTCMCLWIYSVVCVLSLVNFNLHQLKRRTVFYTSPVHRCCQRQHISVSCAWSVQSALGCTLSLATDGTCKWESSSHDIHQPATGTPQDAPHNVVSDVSSQVLRPSGVLLPNLQAHT